MDTGEVFNITVSNKADVALQFSVVDYNTEVGKVVIGSSEDKSHVEEIDLTDIESIEFDFLYRYKNFAAKIYNIE
jgi:hypothetical protein